MTSDETTRIIELKKKIQKFVDDRDWTKYHNPKDLAISIAIEASELMELFQWVREDELKKILDDPSKLTRLEEELADIMIYCLSLANVINMDVTQAVTKKVSKNEEKYPVERIRGSYKKYTEL